MPHCTRTKEDVAGRVADMFRLASRDYGLDLKRLELLSGLSYETLKSYRNGVAIPLHAYVQLARYIPDELLSLCINGAGKHVGTDEPDDGDLDALGREGAHFLAEKADAEADGVITHIERAKLGNRARRIAAVARKVAA